MQGGQFVQLFHKELEAYQVAECLFQEGVTENGARFALILPFSSFRVSLAFSFCPSYPLCPLLQCTCASASSTR